MTDNDDPSQEGYVQEVEDIFDESDAVNEARRAFVQTDINDAERTRDCLLDLSNALSARYQRYGAIDDLQESYEYELTAFDTLPDDHPERPMYMNNLSISLSSLSQAGVSNPEEDESDYLTQAVAMGYAAIKAAGIQHPSLPLYHNTLSSALLVRYDENADPHDLEEAIKMGRVAVNTSQEDKAKVVYQLNLSRALTRYYQKMGDFTQLEEVVKLCRASISSFTGLELERVPLESISMLGVALMTRYEARGDLRDLEEGLLAARRAFITTPPYHPAICGRCLNYCAALWHNYERYGETADLQLSIDNLKEALKASTELPRPTLRKLYLLLTVTLLARYERSLKQEDVVDAAHFARASVDNLALSDHQTRSPGDLVCWINLCVTLHTLYQSSGNLADLDDAIKFGHEAATSAPQESPEIHLCFGSLSAAYFDRWRRLRSLDDLKTSLDFGRQAVRTLSDAHPEWAKWKINVARALLELSEVEENGTNHIQDAYDCYSQVASSPTTSCLHRVRFDAAHQWATNAYSHRRSSYALKAYTICFSLIPHLVWVGAYLITREEALSEVVGLAADAASCAIDCGNLPLAVEFLEQGRSILWQQLAQLKSDSETLREAHPEFAERLQTLAGELERHGSGGGFALIRSSLITSDSERIVSGSRRRALAHEWEELVGMIRRLEGFGDFLRPPSYSKLRLAASRGPIVLFSCSKMRCDALIVSADNDVSLVPLHPLTMEEISKMSRIVTSVTLGPNNARAGKSGPSRGPFNAEKLLESVLDKLWKMVVMPVLMKLKDLQVCVRHIWWCPTGPFTSLPVHAAFHRRKVADELIGSLDDVISSYTPTLSLLLRTPPLSPNHKESFLAVGVSRAQKATALPAVPEEISALRDIIDPPSFKALLDEEASVLAVLDAFPHSSWVHLACHGKTSDGDPMFSSLFLSDGLLGIRRIIATPLPYASVVFLSACETAVGSAKWPDEALHIAGGMLFAGFHSAVATLWRIRDEDGPAVARDFYRHLLERNREANVEQLSSWDPTHVAEALHFATKRLRDAGVSPLSRMSCWC